MLRERKNIILALPEGRQVQLHCTEPVVEVRAELLHADHFLYVGVGGGNDAHIRPDQL